MMKIEKFQLETLTCPTCITKIEGVLSKEKGIEEAKVLFNSSKVKVTFEEEIIPADTIINLIEKLGYPVIRKKSLK